MRALATAAVWLLAACSGPAQPAGAPAEPTSSAASAPPRFVLSDPEAFDLRMAEDLFTTDGRGLPEYPDVDTCHMQGIAIAGDTLMLSCVLFESREPEKRTVIGKSYVLAAPLCDIVGCAGPPRGAVSWTVHDITEPVPDDENHRITRQLLGKQELSDDERAIRHLLSHPSGLVADPAGRGIWVANAGYSEESYASILLLDPLRLGSAAFEPLERHTVKRHVAALAVLENRYILGWTWATENFLVMDTRTGEVVIRPNPVVGSADHIDIQDCDHWDGPYILCNGVYRYEASPDAPTVPLPRDALQDPDRDTLRVRLGRVQVLEVDVSAFPQVEVTLRDYAKARLPGSDEPHIDFGRRIYRVDRDGNEQHLVNNDYGGYTLHKPLTYEGMAVSPDRQHIYFLPADLPQGKLIRMRLHQL